MLNHILHEPIMADYDFPPSRESVDAAKRDLIAFRLKYGLDPDPYGLPIQVPDLVAIVMVEEAKRASRES